MIDLRHGRWQDVLADVDQVDAVITDPPYSRRQKRGYRSGSQVRRGVHTNGHRGDYVIPYEAWTEADAVELAHWATGHVRWWVVAFGDHIIWRWLDSAFESVGWWVFAPVGWVKPNPAPRMQADGPCCAVEHILVARPRHRLPPARRGHRRGAYYSQVCPSGEAPASGPRLVGAKPLALIEQVLLDYTLPCDLIAEPFGGSGTTLVAAHRLGRSCIGAEVDPDTYAQARARIDRELAQGQLFTEEDAHA